MVVPLRAIAVALLAAALPAAARANPEPPAINDARGMGMGGAVVATVESPSALFHNPAGLDHVERFSASFVFTPLLVNFDAPFAGPGSEQESGIIFAPLVFAGTALRVHERVTLGLGAYIITGFGGGFDAVPQVDDMPIEPPADQTVFLVVWELAVPVAVRVSDEWSLGLSLRLPFARQEVDLWQEIFPNPDPARDTWIRVRQSVSGVGIPGVLVGAQYRPRAFPRLTLGFAYRSKVKIEMDGTTRALEMDLDTHGAWRVPHMIRVGAAVRLAHDRLTLATELRMQFHHEANERQTFRVDLAGIPPIVADFGWYNVVVLALGGEFLATDQVAVRLGGSIANSATNARAMTPFMPPPGLAYAIYGGFGFDLGPVDLDLAGQWGFGAFTLDSDQPGCNRSATLKAGCAGSYEVDSFFISLGVTVDL